MNQRSRSGDIFADSIDKNHYSIDNSHDSIDKTKDLIDNY